MSDPEYPKAASRPAPEMTCEEASRLLSLATVPTPGHQNAGAMVEQAGLLFRQGELAPSELESFALHLQRCRECQADVAVTLAVVRAFAGEGDHEPAPNLVAQSRVRLDALLDREGRRGGLAGLLHTCRFHAGRLRAAPGLAAAVLLVGLGGGFWGGYRAGHATRVAEQAEIVLDPPEHPHPQVVADVSRIVREGGASDRVEVSYDLLDPQVISGSLDDPSIQRLLLLGLEDGADAGVRKEAINLLTADGSPPSERALLLRVLATDEDPRVRLEALQGLAPYVGEDLGVRDAVVHAVMRDKSAELRMEGVRLLSPVGVDSGVRRALHAVAIGDGDPYIRNASQQVLAGMPPVQ